jgi:hypothetical protein
MLYISVIRVKTCTHTQWHIQFKFLVHCNTCFKDKHDVTLRYATGELITSSDASLFKYDRIADFEYVNNVNTATSWIFLHNGLQKLSRMCIRRTLIGTTRVSASFRSLVMGDLKGHSNQKSFMFLKTFLYILSDKSDYFEVKLNKIKTCFSSFRMRILCHVTGRRGWRGGITMFEEPDDFSSLVVFQDQSWNMFHHLRHE